MSSWLDSYCSCISLSNAHTQVGTHKCTCVHEYTDTDSYICVRLCGVPKDKRCQNTLLKKNQSEFSNISGGLIFVKALEKMFIATVTWNLELYAMVLSAFLLAQSLDVLWFTYITFCQDT